MVPLALPVVATLSDPGAAKNLRGLGTVEQKLDANSYVIATSQGRVTVTLTEGSLAENAAVSISRQGNRVTIQPLLPSTQPAVPAADTYSSAEEPFDLTTTAGTRNLLTTIATITAKPGEVAADPESRANLDAVVSSLSANRNRYGAATGALIDRLGREAVQARADNGTPGAAGRTVASLLSGIARRIDETLPAPAPVVTIGNDEPEGFVQFASAGEAAAWLQSKGADPSEVARAMAGRGADRPVVVYTFRGPDGTMSAALLDEKSAADELSHLASAELKSTVWQQVGGGVLADALAARGSIALEDLLAIDQTLLAGGTPPVSPSGIPDLAGRLGQWLSSALDPAAGAPIVAARPPLFAASDILNLFENLSSGDGSDPLADLPMLTKDTTSAGSASTVPAAAQALGIDFERSLLAGDGADALSASVKARLYQMLASTEPALSPDGMSPPAAGSVASTAAADASASVGEPSVSLPIRDQNENSDVLSNLRVSISSRIDRVFEPLLKSMDMPTAGQGAPVAGSLSAQMRSLAESLGNKAESLETAIAQAGQDASRQLAGALPADQATPTASSQEAESPIAATAQNLRSAVAGIENDLGQLSSSVRAALQDLSHDIAQRSADLSDRLDNISSQMATATPVQKTNLEKQVDSLIQAFTKDTQQLVQNTIKAIKGQVDQTLDAAGSRLSAAASRVQTSGAPETLRSAAEPSTPPPSIAVAAEQMRRQVESALKGMESLQVLARPTQAADGQQQVLALPMRIDGAWKEVTIRLLRRQSPKDGSGKGKGYGVSIAVSPSAVGDLAVSLDYRPGNPLNVTMNFEQPKSRQWFEENRVALGTALQGAGFKAVNLQFGKIANKPTVEVVNEEQVGAGIDIRA